MGPAQGAGREALRCLHGAELIAVDGLTVPAADGVDHRDRGHDDVGPGDHGIDHRTEQAVAGDGTGRIVDEDDRGVVGDHVEAGAHRRRPGVAAGHDRVDRRLDRCLSVGRHDEDDAVGHRPGGVDRPVDDAAPGQLLVLLRRPEPVSYTHLTLPTNSRV